MADFHIMGFCGYFIGRSCCRFDVDDDLIIDYLGMRDVR